MFGKDEQKIPELKAYLKDVTFPFRSVFNIDSRKGSNELEELFGRRDIFKNAKSTELIAYFVDFVSKGDDIIMDSFAGSGTTGDAVLRLRSRAPYEQREGREAHQRKEGSEHGGSWADRLVLGSAAIAQNLGDKRFYAFGVGSSVNRFLIERPVYEAFCERFAAATAALTLGPGIEDRDLGPLMNEKAVAKQAEHVADAVERGARLLTGGKVSPLGPLFYEATVLADVPVDAKIFHEETFGPVAAIAPFDTEEEAVERANDTEYDLVGYVHTQDPRRIYRVSRALSFGMVAVNRTKVTGAPIPFGGMKQSGIGREGAADGMRAFMDLKYVCRDWG